MEFPSNKTVKLWHTENEMFWLLETPGLAIWTFGEKKKRKSEVGGWLLSENISFKKILHQKADKHNG